MNATEEKIIEIEQLLPKLALARANGQRIVFTNGCFDLMHLGHVTYLEAARNQGDLLVIGLNTDASVSRLKGPQRPIISEQARARVMAALEVVSYVVLFDEDTPLNLIRSVKPDILVKGADYQVSEIVGADFVMASGGKVERIPFVEGYSTSSLIERIQNLGA